MSESKGRVPFGGSGENNKIDRNQDDYANDKHHLSRKHEKLRNNDFFEDFKIVKRLARA